MAPCNLATLLSIYPVYTRNSICPGCVSGTDLVLRDCVVQWELGRLVVEGKVRCS